MKGKLIVLEGTDGSGKSTQFSLLCDAFEREGKGYKKVIFPRYSEPSSALVRMYLAGEFGGGPEDVSPYAASTFFAVDRFASFRREWGGYYENGGLVLADRYTTSNAIHQAAKLPEEEREAFEKWLFDFEYRLLELPRPDLVIFFDMPTEFALKLLAARTGKQKDIHEKDAAYLESCRRAALRISARFGWHKIDCADKGRIRSIEEIHGDVRAALARMPGGL